MEPSVTEAAKTTPSTRPSLPTIGPPELPGADQGADGEDVAHHGALAVDVGAAQPLLGPDPRSLHVVRPVLRVAEHRARSPGLALPVELQRRATEVGDLEHGDVDVGVVVDDLRLDLAVVGHDPRAVHPGDDVGVGHHPGGGVEEAGALDAAAAAVLAADLQHALRGGAHLGVAGDAGRRGPHLDDALGRKGSR